MAPQNAYVCILPALLAWLWVELRMLHSTLLPWERLAMAMQSLYLHIQALDECGEVIVYAPGWLDCYPLGIAANLLTAPIPLCSTPSFPSPVPIFSSLAERLEPLTSQNRSGVDLSKLQHLKRRAYTHPPFLPTSNVEPGYGICCQPSRETASGRREQRWWPRPEPVHSC